MRFRFWLGFAAVAVLAIGSVTAALVVHSNEEAGFHQTQRDEATRAARQAEAVANLSVGQLASAAAFYQAERHFNRARVRADRPSAAGSGRPDRDRVHSASAALRTEALRTRTRLPDRRKGGAGQRPAQGRRSPRLLPPHRRRLRGGHRTAARLRRRRRPQAGAVPASGPRHRPPGGDPGHATCRSASSASTSTGRSTARARRPARLAQRRAALVGFAVGAFRVRSLAAAAISAVPHADTVQLRIGGTGRDRPPRHARRPRQRADPRRRSGLAAGRPRSRSPGHRPADPDGGGRDLARVAARGADPGLEPQRADGGAAARGRPGLADRAEEPPPLRGRPARRDGPQSPHRARRARC